jgi:anti-anti-sigma regulatory factor/anti-sigma regulatory factor (Ser/Thr protein kinase)
VGSVGLSEPLDCQVERDFPVAVVRMRGALDLHGADRVRPTLVTCLAEQPSALVVDLADVRVTEDLALGLFPALRRRAAAWPGTAVLLYAPMFELAQALRRTAVARQVPTYATRTEALAAAAGYPVPPRIRQVFLPSRDAPQHARAVVAGACAAWGLPDTTGSAQLIASELVANGVVHARTMLEFCIALHERRLQLSVRDSDPTPPRRAAVVTPESEGGRGLLVVEAIAAAWGCVKTVDGKVVWATLSVHPQAAAEVGSGVRRERSAGAE